MQKDFEEILTDFFKKYDNRQLRHNKPHKIAVLFKGREDEVMEHICKKYDVDPKTIAGMNLSSPSQPPSDPEHPESASAQEASTASAGEAKGVGSDASTGSAPLTTGPLSMTDKDTTEEAVSPPDETLAEPDEKPKSKKKLVIIILIVILLAAAGAAGYFFKDKIFGETTATEQETPRENIEEVTPAKDEADKAASEDSYEEDVQARQDTTDGQASEEADETEEVKEEGNDEEGSDEETSGEEE
ncbi:hypothetical protein JYU16_01270 [bacterium AH-315-M05]|nr:hypothetical protein [bacterium AH-315-M05]